MPAQRMERERRIEDFPDENASPLVSVPGIDNINLGAFPLRPVNQFLCTNRQFRFQDRPWTRFSLML